MLQEQAHRPRDYGGWRRQRGIGLWGLGTTGTFAVLATTVVVILVAAIDVRALIYMAPPVVVTAGPGSAASHSRSRPSGVCDGSSRLPAVTPSTGSAW